MGTHSHETTVSSLAGGVPWRPAFRQLGLWWGAVPNLHRGQAASRQAAGLYLNCTREAQITRVHTAGLYAGMGKSDGLAQLMPCKNKLGQSAKHELGSVRTFKHLCTSVRLREEGALMSSKHQVVAAWASYWLARIP